MLNIANSMPMIEREKAGSFLPALSMAKNLGFIKGEKGPTNHPLEFNAGIGRQPLFFAFVVAVGLEPTRCYPTDFKSAAYADSATRPFLNGILYYHGIPAWSLTSFHFRFFLPHLHYQLYTING